MPAGVRVEEPIVTSVIQATRRRRCHWRSLIVVEEGAEVTVAEQWLSSADDLEGYFNPVTELFVGDGANVEYLCVQDLSERSWILGSQRAQVGARRDRCTGSGSGLGSGQGKLRMETDINGARRRRARVTGAYAGHGTPAHRLRHDAGARRARTRLPTSPSAASCATARPRSGAA